MGPPLPPVSLGRGGLPITRMPLRRFPKHGGRGGQASTSKRPAEGVRLVDHQNDYDTCALTHLPLPPTRGNQTARPDRQIGNYGSLPSRHKKRVPRGGNGTVENKRSSFALWLSNGQLQLLDGFRANVCTSSSNQYVQ